MHVLSVFLNLDMQYDPGTDLTGTLDHDNGFLSDFLMGIKSRTCSNTTVKWAVFRFVLQ